LDLELDLVLERVQQAIEWMDPPFGSLPFELKNGNKIF
jgi:hypothetical protein